MRDVGAKERNGKPRHTDNMRGEDRKTVESKGADLLNKVGLGEFKEKFPIQLSGGMQRRAELARAMINEPQMMIMDEPFRGLDAMSRELMQEFFVRLYEENRRTNLFVTSEIDEAIFLADHLVVVGRDLWCGLRRTGCSRGSLLGQRGRPRNVPWY